MPASLNDPKALEALFGAGTKNPDGSVSWNLTGDDAAKKLGLEYPGSGGGGSATPPLPTPPPAPAETMGPPVFIPSGKGTALRAALLAGILLVELLQLAVLLALLVLHLSRGAPSL